MSLSHMFDTQNFGDDIAEKYQVHTYEDYKAWAIAEKESGEYIYPEAVHYTPLQQLAAFTASLMYLTQSKPRYLVINLTMVGIFVDAGEEIPQEFEGIQLTYDESQPFKLTGII